jgi:hypothetical protein
VAMTHPKPHKYGSMLAYNRWAVALPSRGFIGAKGTNGREGG